MKIYPSNMNHLRYTKPTAQEIQEQYYFPCSITVLNLTTKIAEVFYYDGDGAECALGKTEIPSDYLIKKSLSKTDAAPTVIGLYPLKETGTYANLGNINAEAGKLNFASFDGSAWSLVNIDINIDFIKSEINGIEEIKDYQEIDWSYDVPENSSPWNNAFNIIPFSQNGFIYAFKVGLKNVNSSTVIKPFVCNYDDPTHTISNYQEIETITNDKYVSGDYFIQLSAPKEVSQGQYFGIKVENAIIVGKGDFPQNNNVIGLNSSNAFQQKLPGFLFKQSFWFFPEKSENNRVLINQRNALLELTPNTEIDILENVKFKSFDIFDKIPNFLGKLNNAQFSSNYPTKSATIVCVGDSIWGLTQHNTVLSNPTEMPPSLVAKNAMTNLFLEIAKKHYKADYKRFDYASAFTENGTFSTITASNQGYNWYDLDGGACHTRVGTTSNCYVQFQIDAKYPAFNFLDRTSINGVNQTVSVTQGNGYLQVLNSSNQWVEANGYVFSQLENDTSIRSNTTYQRRIRFRKTTSHKTDIVNIRITSSVNLLMYWGVELFERNYFEFINIGHGGRDINEFKGYIENEIYDRNPDLLLLELPLLNMIPYLTSLDDLKLRLDEFIFGDGRNGSTANTNALKVKSNNWADFEVIFVIPNFAIDYFSDNTETKSPNSPYNRMDFFRFAYGYLRQNKLAVIDISSEMIDYALLNFVNIQDFVEPSGVNGGTMLAEGIHPNDFGAKFICKLLKFL